MAQARYRHHDFERVPYFGENVFRHGFGRLHAGRFFNGEEHEKAENNTGQADDKKRNAPAIPFINPAADQKAQQHADIYAGRIYAHSGGAFFRRVKV